MKLKAHAITTVDGLELTTGRYRWAWVEGMRFPLLIRVSDSPPSEASGSSSGSSRKRASSPGASAGPSPDLARPARVRGWHEAAKESNGR